MDPRIRQTMDMPTQNACWTSPVERIGNSTAAISHESSLRTSTDPMTTSAKAATSFPGPLNE